MWRGESDGREDGIVRREKRGGWDSERREGRGGRMKGETRECGER